MTEKKTAQLVALIPQSTMEQIDGLAARSGVSKAVVVRAALKHGLRMVARDARRGKVAE